MIALFGLPGSSQFCFIHVSTRAEGEVWLDRRANEPEPTQESMNNRRQSRVISNRDAMKLRWADGSRIVTRDMLADAEYAETSAAEYVAMVKKCSASRGAGQCGECTACGKRLAEWQRGECTASGDGLAE